MAQAFNLASTLQIQGVTGIQNALNQVKSAFSNTAIDVNIRVSPASIKNLDDLNARILTLRNNLVSIQSSVGAATGSVGNFGNGIGNSTSGINRFTASVNTAQTTVATVRKEIEQGSTAMEQFGSSAGLAGRRFVAFSLAAGGIIALIQGLRTGVGAALEFQQSMTKLSQVSGETPDKLRDIQTEVTRLSTALGVSSSELINVAVTLKQAGLTATQTKVALQGIAEAALAPNFGSMNEIVEGSIAIFRQFDQDVNNLRGHLGALNAVAAEFAVEGRDLVEVVRRSGGAFRQTGGELTELIGLFTAVRSTTRESAESISTGLRTIFTRIQRPETVEALRDLNIQLRYTRDEAVALGQVNLTDQFVGAYEAIRRVSEGLSSLRPTDSRFGAIIEELGGYRQISRVVPLINQFTEAQRALNVARAGEVALQASTERAQESLLNRTTQVKEQFLALFRTIADSSGFQTLTRGMLSLASSMASLLEFATPLLPVLTALAGVKIAQGLTGFGTRALSTAFYGTPTVRRASGGVIPGVGDSDTVPAMLTPGEYVIRKESAQKFGYDRLAAINARGYATGGRVQRFATGGKVQAFEGGGQVFKLSDPSVAPYETIIRSELQNKLGITFKETFAEINKITDRSLRALVKQIEAVVLPDKLGKQQFAGLNLGPLPQAYNVARTVRADNAQENRDIVTEFQSKEKPRARSARDTEIKTVTDFTAKYQNNQSAPEYQQFLKNYQLPIKKFDSFSANYSGGFDLESRGVSSFTAQAAFVKAIERQSASGKGFDDFNPGKFIRRALELAAKDVATKIEYVEAEKPEGFVGPGRKKQVKVTKDKILSTDYGTEGSVGDEISGDARRRGRQGSEFIPYGNFAGDKSGQAAINSARKIAKVTNGGLDDVLPKILAQAVAADEKQVDEGIKSLQAARSETKIVPPTIVPRKTEAASLIMQKLRAKQQLLKQEIDKGTSYDAALNAIAPPRTVPGPAGYDPGQRPFGILPPTASTVVLTKQQQIVKTYSESKAAGATDEQARAAAKAGQVFVPTPIQPPPPSIVPPSATLSPAQPVVVNRVLADRAAMEAKIAAELEAVARTKREKQEAEDKIIARKREADKVGEEVRKKTGSWDQGQSASERAFAQMSDEELRTTAKASGIRGVNARWKRETLLAKLEGVATPPVQPPSPIIPVGGNAAIYPPLAPLVTTSNVYPKQPVPKQLPLLIPNPGQSFVGSFDPRIGSSMASVDTSVFSRPGGNSGPVFPNFARQTIETTQENVARARAAAAVKQAVEEETVKLTPGGSIRSDVVAFMQTGKVPSGDDTTVAQKSKKKPHKKEILKTAYGNFDINDPDVLKNLKKPLDPDLLSVKTVFDKERIPVGGGLGALGQYNDPAIIARIEKLKALYGEPNLGGFLPGETVQTSIGGQAFPNPKKAGGSIAADARFLALLTRAGLSGGAPGLEAYPYDLNDPKVQKELEQFEKLAKDRARKRKQPPVSFDVAASSKSYVPPELGSSIFTGLPQFAGRGAGLGDGQVQSNIGRFIGEGETFNGIPQLPGLPRLVGGSGLLLTSLTQKAKANPTSVNKAAVTAYQQGDNFGSNTIFNQVRGLITKRIGVDSPDTIAQYVANAPLLDAQKTSLMNIIAQAIGKTQPVQGPPTSLSNASQTQARINASIAAGTTGPDSLGAQRARNNNFIDPLSIPLADRLRARRGTLSADQRNDYERSKLGRAVPLFNLLTGEGQLGSRNPGVGSAFDISPSNVTKAITKEDIAKLPKAEREAAKQAEKQRRKDLIAAQAGRASLPAVDFRQGFPETAGVVNQRADRIYEQFLRNRGGTGVDSAGIGAGPVSDTTKAQLRARALSTAEARSRREFVSAEQRAIQAANPGRYINQRELRLLAEESYGRVQSGQEKLIQKDGRILGSESGVSNAQQANPNARLGASGATLFQNRFGERYDALTDRLSNSPGRLARVGGFGLSTLGGFAGGVARQAGNVQDFLGQRPGVGYAAYMGISSLSQDFSNRAGTALNAATRGETGSIGDAVTGTFTGNRAIASGLQSGLIGGVVAGSLASGPAAPFIIAGAALTAAVYGVASSLKESKKEINEAKIGQALTNLGDQLAILARPGGQGSDPGVGANALANLRSVRTEQQRRVETNLSGVFFGNGRLNSSNGETYFANLRRDQRRDQAGQLPQAIQALNNQAEFVGRTGANRENIADLVTEFQNGGAGLNQELLRLVAELRGVTVAAALNDFKKVIEQTKRAEQVRQQAQQARGGEEGGANAFARLASSFQNASDSLGELRLRANALSDLFSNSSSGARINLGGSALTPGADQRETARVLQTIASVGGESGGRLQRVGNAASEIESVLPNILYEISRTTQGQSEEAFGTALRSSLTRAFGGRDAINARPEIGQGINTVVAQANLANREGAIGREIEVDVSALVRRLIDPFASAGRESSARITSLLEANANSFIDGLSKLTDRMNQIGETRDRAVGAGVSLARTRAEIEGQRTGNERTAITSLPLNVLNAEFISRQSRLLGGASASTSPEDIGLALNRVQNLIPGAAVEQERLNRDNPNSDQARQSSEYLNTLRGRAQNLQRALDNLANASNQNAVIQERLNTIAQDRQARLSYAERFSTSSTEGRLEQNRGAALFIQAGLNPENFRNFTPDQQSSAIQAGRSLGNINAPAFGGRNVQDVTDQLVRILQPGFTGLPAGGQEEERTLQRALIANLDNAQEALRVSAAAQLRTTELLSTNLNTQQQNFFASLNSYFQRDRLTTLEVRRGNLEQESLRLGRNGNVDQLRAIGVNTDEDVRRAQGLSGEFSRYFGARQVNQNLVDTAGRISGLSESTLGQGQLFEGLSGRNSVLNVGPFRTSFSEEAERRYNTFLNRPEFNGVTQEQRGQITARFLENTRNLNAADSESIQFRPNAPRSQEIISEQFVQAVRSILLPGGVDRNGVPLRTLANDNFRELNQSSSAIANRGFGLPTNVNTPLQATAFLETLNSFNQTNNRFSELPVNILRVNTELGNLAEEIIRIRGTLGEVFIPISRPTEEQALNGFGFESSVPFAYGGMARGTDTVPAMLTPGEFVVNRDSAATNSALLQRINQARGPVYLADGGVAGDEIAFPVPPQTPNLDRVIRAIRGAGLPGRLEDLTRQNLERYSTFGLFQSDRINLVLQELERRRAYDDSVTPLAEFGPAYPNPNLFVVPPPAPAPVPPRPFFDAVNPAVDEGVLRVPRASDIVARFRPLRPGGNIPEIGNIGRNARIAERRELPVARQLVENPNLDDQLRVQATIDPFGNAGSYLAGQSARDNYLGQAGQYLAGVTARRTSDLAIVNSAAERRERAIANSAPDEAERINRQTRAAQRRLNATAGLSTEEGITEFGRLQSERAERFGQFIQQRNFDVGQANNLVERQLNAQSQNPFAAFGIGRADAGTQASISQGILSDLQRRRDRQRVGDFGGNDGFGLTAPQQIPGNRVLRRAAGGTVPGTGFGDTVPALLTPGEYVLSRGNVQNLGGTGNVSRLANGGPVGNLAQGSGSGVSAELIAAINTFGSSSSNLVTGFERFNESANALAQALTNFPAKMEVNGRQTVEVIFNGAEVFNKIQPELMSMVEAKTKEMINKVFKDNLPEANVNIE